MKKLSLYIALLLCIFNLCTIKAQQQNYKLSTVEYSDQSYRSKMTLTY